jgi:8-oxo-dGTP pyrophosphatase MutT (NUDIX family)
LLVTSRETSRWIIPKGNIGRGKTPLQAALIEAREEAGLKGAVASAVPLGFYTYSKRLKGDRVRPATVEVYVLKVKQQSKKWPEKKERKLAWLPLAEAAHQVEEPGLVPLLRRLMELEADLAGPETVAAPGRSDNSDEVPSANAPLDAAERR